MIYTFVEIIRIWHKWVKNELDCFVPDNITVHDALVSIVAICFLTRTDVCRCQRSYFIIIILFVCFHFVITSGISGLSFDSTFSIGSLVLPRPLVFFCLFLPHSPSCQKCLLNFCSRGRLFCFCMALVFSVFKQLGDEILGDMCRHLPYGTDSSWVRWFF